MIITLRCSECENTECGICPVGSWIKEGSLRGCTRIVSEDEYIEYEHMNNEVIPFLSMNKNTEYKKEAYKKFIGLLNKFYNHPIGAKLGTSGKVLSK